MVTFTGRINIDSDQCVSCFFYIGAISDGLACYAFPAGIPTEIITGEYDHRNRYPGDAGITWREDENWARPIQTEDEE